jgi:hypothetical protein
MDDSAQDIQKKIDALPAEAKAFLYSSEMGTIIHDIGTKYKLHVDQIGALESEAAAVIIGITKPDELVQNLIDEVNVDQHTSEAIAKEINDKVFLKVRSTMKASTFEKTASVIADMPKTPVVSTTVPVVSAPSMEPVTAPKPVTPPIQTPAAAPISKPVTPITPAPAAPVIPKPVTPPATQAPVAPAAPASAPVAPKPAGDPKADMMLSQKTVQVAPTAQTASQGTAPVQASAAAKAPTTPATNTPPAPQPYSASDPYREPIE